MMNPLLIAALGVFLLSKTAKAGPFPKASRLGPDATVADADDAALGEAMREAQRSADFRAETPLDKPSDDPMEQIRREHGLSDEQPNTSGDVLTPTDPRASDAAAQEETADEADETPIKR